VSTTPCQEQQEFKAALVAPVQIFNDEQQRLVCGGSSKKMQ